MKAWKLNPKWSSFLKLKVQKVNYIKSNILSSVISGFAQSQPVGIWVPSTSPALSSSRINIRVLSLLRCMTSALSPPPLSPPHPPGKTSTSKSERYSSSCIAQWPRLHPCTGNLDLQCWGQSGTTTEKWCDLWEGAWERKNKWTNAGTWKIVLFQLQEQWKELCQGSCLSLWLSDNVQVRWFHSSPALEVYPIFPYIWTTFCEFLLPAARGPLAETPFLRNDLFRNVLPTLKIPFIWFLELSSYTDWRSYP